MLRRNGDEFAKPAPKVAHVLNALERTFNRFQRGILHSLCERALRHLLFQRLLSPFSHPTMVFRFEVPGLRNVALTGPYMHNGGMSTLEQVIEFYGRGGDFAHDSRGVLDRGITPLHLTEEEEGLHAFLLTLADPRVRWERAPFDHPELLISNGYPGDERGIDCALRSIRACDDVLRIPAVGRKGRAPLGFAPLENFAERLDP